MKRILWILIIALYALSTVSVYGEIDESDINYFLEKIATAQDDMRELGVELLITFLDKPTPDVDGLKRAIRLTATSEDIQKLEDNGYTLDEALDSLDILSEMEEDDIEDIIAAVDNQDVEDMKEIIEKYLENEDTPTGGEGGASESEEELISEEEPVPVEEMVLEVKFTDTENHWAKDTIHFLASREIIQGRSEESFDPDSSISRAEFTALIIRLLNLEPIEDVGVLDFDDVKEGDWYFQIVRIANSKGIINGLGKGQFAPNAPITREEMVTIINRALSNMDLTLEERGISIDKFQDKENISEWARENISKALNLGLIEGRQENLFDPKGLATRAEAATMIKRVYDLLDK